MITKLDAITDIRVRAALERSADLAVEVTNRPPGAVVALVTCTGGCGLRHLLDTERHSVVLHHDGTVTCDCISVQLCKHGAALVAHEDGALPANPRSHLPTPQCREMCSYDIPALWADGGNGHGQSCVHRDNEAQRRPNPYAEAAG